MRDIARLYLDQIARCAEKIADLETSIRSKAAATKTATRLQTMPGIGPIGAMAIEAFAPPMQEFRRGRDFAAWLGLVPRQKSTGGKQILGRTSEMGQRDIRRLLIICAMAVVRAAIRKEPPGGGDRADQQDGARHLGHVDETGELSGSDGDDVTPVAIGAPGM